VSPLPADEDVMFRALDPSFSGHNAPPPNYSDPQVPGQSNNSVERVPAVGGSMELQALYASEAVKAAFVRLFRRDEPGTFVLCADDGSDDDEAWEDNMDPLTFARYYAGPSNPHFVKMVQDHDRETRARFDLEMKAWAAGVVVSEDSEHGAN